MEFLCRVAYSVAMTCTSHCWKLEVSDPSRTMERSHDSEVNRTAEQTLDVDIMSSESVVESQEIVRNIEERPTAERIEHSKRHWSELSTTAKLGSTEECAGDSVESDCIDEEELERVAVDNREVFKALESDPIWGEFFRGKDDFAELEVKEKFAEGAQAELFHVGVTWWKQEYNEWDEEGVEHVLKVFKEGTSLRHLQSQWPQGMLQFQMQEMENWESPTPKRFDRYYCDVQYGVLLEDGRFAFLLEKESGDLRSLIEEKMTLGKDCGPFSKEHAEHMMWDVALGMEWLHSHNIIHRDLKASNVLVRARKGDAPFQCFVADYDCSIGVVGTGFFRAPEILEACKDRSISKRPELFTEASDVYSYGMTCYEILTGQLPFDGHSINNYDLVLNGGRPEVPRYVDNWICELLDKCWQSKPEVRCSFGEILNLILSNSNYIRKLIEKGYIRLDAIEWVKWKV